MCYEMIREPDHVFHLTPFLRVVTLEGVGTRFQSTEWYSGRVVSEDPHTFADECAALRAYRGKALDGSDAYRPHVVWPEHHLEV